MGQEAFFMYSRRESNPDQQFRKLLFYPLNYENNIFQEMQRYLLKWRKEGEFFTF